MSASVFVGRTRELQQLQRLLDSSLSGHSGVAFIAGEAGSGKTSLVQEFVTRAQAVHAGLVVALGSCDAQTGIGDPYLPFREVLRQLTGSAASPRAESVAGHENTSRLRGIVRMSGQALAQLGPDLMNLFVPGSRLAIKTGFFVADKVGLGRRGTKQQDVGHMLDSGELDQSRIFEQYTDVLGAIASRRPLVLILDDLQWADAASVSLLFHLVRRLEGQIVILGTFRPADLAAGRLGDRHPMEPVLHEIERYRGDIIIDLDVSDEGEQRAFVDELIDVEPNGLDQAFRQALLERCGGHPLFTVELLRHMKERGDLSRDAEGRWVVGARLDWTAVPARVEGIIAERIDRLDAELRDLLAVASVEGEEFTAEVLALVTQQTELNITRTIARQLIRRHHLVFESGELPLDGRTLARFRFTHALFHQHVYDEVSAAERRVLHAAVAQALEQLAAGQTDAITVQLAHHHAQAGSTAQAVEYWLRAGDRARAIYGYQEAISAYEKALTFLNEQAAHERAARTLMKLGLTYQIAFDFVRARQAYDQGFVEWQRAGAGRPEAVSPLSPHPLRAETSEPSTLDPALAADDVSVSLVDQLFSGLVGESAEMEIVPEAARSWELLDGGRTYAFRLRSDLRWSDGAPVTAYDFEYAWKRMLDAATESPNASLLYDIAGARAAHVEGEGVDEVGVRATDDHTLVVQLESPCSYFPQLLPHLYPVPRHIVDQHGPQWTAPERVATNGPFALESWRPGRSLALTRNRHYPGAWPGNVERVELCWLEWAERIARYEASELDVVRLWDLPWAEIDRVRQRHPDEYFSSPDLATWFLGFNATHPPFDDPRVRRALAHALDREALANSVRGGYQFPASGGIVPPGMPGHSPGLGLAFDVGWATQLLSEAGFASGGEVPPVTLLASQGMEVEADYVRDQWRQCLGLDVDCEIVPGLALPTRLSHDAADAFLAAWQPDYPDPDSVLRASPLMTVTRWASAEYDELVERARQVTDQAERMKLYARADQLLVHDASIVPLMYGRHHLLIKPWVRRYPVSAINLWFWKDVIIERH
jgi:ABC-type oligopeptide transport system substrate-binding subunit